MLQIPSLRTVVLVILALVSFAAAQSVDPSLYQSMKWRHDRPVSWRPHGWSTGRRIAAKCLLHRRQQRRRLEDE